MEWWRRHEDGVINSQETAPRCTAEKPQEMLYAVCGYWNTGTMDASKSPYQIAVVRCRGHRQLWVVSLFHASCTGFDVECKIRANLWGSVGTMFLVGP